MENPPEDELDESGTGPSHRTGPTDGGLDETQAWNPSEDPPRARVEENRPQDPFPAPKESPEQEERSRGRSILPLTAAAAAAISLIAIAAVFSAASYLDARGRHTDAEIRVLSERVNLLARNLDQTQAPATPPPPTPTQAPEPTSPVQTPATSTPEPTTPKTKPDSPPESTSAGIGICGRSPEVQNAILHTLGVSTCQLVERDELHGIARLGNSNIDVGRGLHLGDFAGLVNVKSLNLEAREDFKIRAGSLEGLDGLESLTLSLHPHGTIEPGAFQGMPQLRDLAITARRITHERGREFSVPPIDPMPNLESLSVSTHRWMPALRTHHLTRLPNLERLEIHGRSQDGVYQLPPGLFQSNPRLREIRIRAEGAAIEAPPGIFSHLDQIQWLYLEHLYSEENRPEFRISARSPLMEDISSGEQQLWSYSVLSTEETGEEE